MENEKVLVTKSLLDELGNKFKSLTGENKQFTIQEMINANVQGGSGELMLKLVATGTWNESNESFDLDNELEEGKAYLIEYYEDSMGTINTAILKVVNKNTWNRTAISVTNMQDYPDVAILGYEGEEILLFPTNNDGEISQVELDYIKVYEITSGVVETSDNIKVAEIEGVYDENKTFYFKKYGLNVDYFKGFRIQIINNNINEIILDYYGLGKLGEETVNNSTNLYCDCYGYDSCNTHDYNCRFQNMALIDGVTFWNEMDGDDEFYINFTSDLANYLDDLTLKLYYVEANELSTPFWYES